jgi:hypothetical protein
MAKNSSSIEMKLEEALNIDNKEKESEKLQSRLKLAFQFNLFKVNDRVLINNLIKSSH